MRIAVERQFVVDCEYNNPTHQLISMAIAPLWPTDGYFFHPQESPDKEFYEVIGPFPSEIDPWVVENVIPHLKKEPISYSLFQKKLGEFLLKHRVQELHYDWCDDIAYFNRALITGPGERLSMPCEFLSHTHHPDIEVASKVAHNALHDARAIAAAIRQRLVLK
ncbi:hypothetical protein LUCX_161 [Xanthomonas phage vB_XciM_LucasX]|nr:hypothetical protein LUCX_161 [Xanthomonas phage vB_XciM_LucasX]